MDINEFDNFRLFGGTSLSLQLGHRESVDIDLFTDSEYGSIDFEKLEKIIFQTFPHAESLYQGDALMGKSYFIGNNPNDLIKLDLFYTDRFVFPLIVYDNIRFASIEEVAAMKLEVIGHSGRKKDFWDLHELLERFSIHQLMEFYFKRYPYSYSKSDLLKKTVDFKNAENDFVPNCYKDKSWELIKLDLEELIK